MKSGDPGLGRLLVVEDDERLRDALKLALRDEGYVVAVAADADSGYASFSSDLPDLVLIDVVLPGRSGLELCRQIRRAHQVPIIVITARDDSHDVVAGLESGADDYVTKPFVFKELAARIRALLRRTRMEEGGADRLEFADLVVIPEEGRVTVRGEDVALTRTEFLLLCELAQEHRRVLSRDRLLTNVWGYTYFGDGRVVDAHIRRLRKKIEPDPSDPTFIVTVRGLGYKFDPQIEEEQAD
jgi:DNA-binding response OmpR family regulator